ncbi:MAG: nuclear transport factor 2 family protein [Eggerthellaceae bacterium]|nr:nuclear transport factor 2 family protein [Eggerthellaceae bacterium]
MVEEEQAVLDAFEAMQRAMIQKDIDAMRQLTTEDKTFTHMSGKVQTREEFFGEIANGTLNYFDYEVHDPHVTIEGDRATLTGSTTLDARVYGVSGSWTLPISAHFAKVDGCWIQCN